jgi:predicted nucleotidyltransferase
MNNIFIDISGKIDAERVSVLGIIKEIAEEFNIPFFVVGAFARDIIFEHIHGIPAPRVTEDIDLGMNVANWEEFHGLTAALIERKHLMATRSPHRFVARTYAVVVDILPYGKIAGDEKRISWPPGHDMSMSMLGFEEAYQSALSVSLRSESELLILVPRIAAQAVLKIISWADAYPTRERDAQDLLYIMENIDMTGMEGMLYETHVLLLAEEAFDTRISSVRLLGREITKIFNPDTVKKVTEILMKETDDVNGYRMLSHMVKGTLFQGVKFESASVLLKKLLQGIRT